MIIRGRLFLCVFLLLPITARAQIAVESRVLRVNAEGKPDPRPVGFKEVCEPEPPNPLTDPELQKDPVGVLNKRFNSGDWDNIQRTAKRLLTEAQHAAHRPPAPAQPDAPAYDYVRNVVWLTWIGEDAFGNIGLRRILVRASTKKSDSTTLAKIDLPGIDRFYEVFINASPKAVLTTVLTSTEQVNPIIEQIPAVAQKLVPVLLGAVGGQLGSVDTSRAQAIPPTVAPGARRCTTPPVRFYATPFQIDLPAKRAKIAVASVAYEPISIGEFRAAASKLALTQSFQLSACARALAGRALDAVTFVTEAPEAGETPSKRCSSGDSRKDCLDRFDARLRQEFDAQKNVAGCSAEAELKAMTAVDTSFRTFIAGNLAREVKGETTVANTPLQHFSFGLMEAVAVKAKVHDPRVKLDDDGNLKADPMPRLLTVVTFNGSFKGYDASSIRPSAAEQWRWFAGGIITPDFGFAGGLSYLPVRGLAVNAGVGVLFIKSPGDAADEIGSPPKSATDPFGLGKATVLFFGASYNFK